MGKADNHSEVLFVYGTLAPGEENHHIMDGMAGNWHPAYVFGTRFRMGWGVHSGHPGLIPDPKGGEIKGLVFLSQDLPMHWARLDAFEGADYTRVTVEAFIEDGKTLDAQIYRVFPKKESKQ